MYLYKGHLFSDFRPPCLSASIPFLVACFYPAEQHLFPTTNDQPLTSQVCFIAFLSGSRGLDQLSTIVPHLFQWFSPGLSTMGHEGGRFWCISAHTCSTPGSDMPRLSTIFSHCFQGLSTGLSPMWITQKHENIKNLQAQRNFICA